jgi:hypothetical protein
MPRYALKPSSEYWRGVGFGVAEGVAEKTGNEKRRKETANKNIKTFLFMVIAG